MVLASRGIQSKQQASEYLDCSAQPADPYLMVDMKKATPGQDDKAVFATVDSLKPGDTVRLTQDHYYVNTERAAYPVRPVTKLEKVEKPANAAEVPASVPATPIQPRMMPGRRAR